MGRSLLPRCIPGQTGEDGCRAGIPSGVAPGRPAPSCRRSRAWGEMVPPNLPSQLWVGTQGKASPFIQVTSVC